MINAILQGIMKLIMAFVTVLTLPIDILIKQFIPELGDMLSAVGSLFNLIAANIGWPINLIGLNQETLQTIIIFFVFKLTAPIAFSAIKNAIKWYKALKL